MIISSRAYTKDDFKACSDLLIESYRSCHNLQNWSIRHWEGQRYHRADLETFPEKPIHVWEDKGKIIAFAHSEYLGSAFLQVLPDYQRMEANMLDWAERHLAISNGDHLNLEAWAYDDDHFREHLLASSGFDQSHFFMVNRRREDNQDLPEAHLAAGYQIRGMSRDMSDCVQMANLLNAAFNRSFHSAQEYSNFQTAPHYRPEYDLVALSPDGTIVANAQLTLVEENGYAEFEPVCTHPEHQRKGLARALIATGLGILRAKGIQTVYVDAASDNPASNALYEQMGFTQTRRLFLWKKSW